MPLTFCHPAIILPLKKLKPNWFSLTGLIIGSMSPDLEYFSRMEIKAIYGHTISGVLFFDLPIALVYCFIFHLFVRNIVIIHLPKYFRSRFLNNLNFNWIRFFKKNWLVVIISIIIGSYSHLFWDAFTHEWGYFAERFSLLQKVWISNPIEVKGYKFLQHFSTFIGGVFIIVCIHFMPKQDIRKVQFDYLFWFKVITLSLIFTVIRFVIFPVEIAIGNIIVVLGMSIFIVLLILGIRDRIRNKKGYQN